MYSTLSVYPNEIQQEDFRKAWADTSPIPETYLHSCWILLNEETPVGRFAFYLNPNLNYEGKKIGAIGQYACIDDEKAAIKLLELAGKIAKENGCEMLIGPFDGSTWNDYRLNTTFKENPFFLEPNYPSYYNNHFKNAGFYALSNYYSQATDVLVRDEIELESKQKEYEALGAHFRKIDLDNYENELIRIADFSNKAFQNNFLFSPIEVETFVAKYLRIKPFVDPDFVFLVDNPNGDLWALCFAIKDLKDPTGKTLILKTLARLKEAPLKGIAYFLGILTGAEATKKGYTKIIHALMQSNNASVKASDKTSGTIISEYVLYGKKL